MRLRCIFCFIIRTGPRERQGGRAFRPIVGRDTSTIDACGFEGYYDTNQWIEETPVMTTLPAPTDALAESQRLIATIERLRGELPFADDI